MSIVRGLFTVFCVTRNDEADVISSKCANENSSSVSSRWVVVIVMLLLLLLLLLLLNEEFVRESVMTISTWTPSLLMHLSGKESRWKGTVS